MGAITKVPNNRRKLDVILQYIAEKFEFDRTYTEKEGQCGDWRVEL